VMRLVRNLLVEGRNKLYWDSTVGLELEGLSSITVLNNAAPPGSCYKGGYDDWSR